MNMKPIAAAALLTTLCLPTSVTADPGVSTIPDNVVAIDPEPDTRVNLGFNAYPYGLQYLTFTFNYDVAVNTACEEKACIYLDGNDTPLQTTGISGVSIDHMQAKIGQLAFPKACTSNGVYRITIPEGFWRLEGANPPYSGAMELNYEILVPQRITPDEQVVKELKEFRLEFPGYDEARLLSPSKIEFFRTGSPEEYPLAISVGKNEDGSNANYILIKLMEPVTEQGEYGLFVQEGAAEGIRYDADNVEKSDHNIETLRQYTISKIDAPQILPSEGVIETFSPFELTVPGNPEFWFVNDRAVCFIYPVDANGTISPDAVYRLTGKIGNGTDKIVLTIIEDGKPQTDVRPAPGSYALKLASGLFSGSWDGDFINSAPFVYYYQVTDTPDGVRITPANDGQGGQREIYTIDGRRIPSRHATESTDNLPEGIYVIDGRKKYIKR